MDIGTQAIYQEIISVAKRQGLVAYGEVAPLAGLDMESPADRDRMSAILDDISQAEHRVRRPLLSAIVIRKDTNRPGEGFFTLAHSLRLYDGGDALAFWSQEVKRVHAYWSQNAP